MIYLDNNATTPCDPEIVERINNLLLDRSVANPSSNHSFGWKANKIYEETKENIASIYNALPNDIVITSGASEANNHAIMGTIQSAVLSSNNRKKILISAIEHKCVLNTAIFSKDLFNYEVDIIPVNEDGIIDLNQLEEMISEDVLIVSVMAVNNEIGTVQPISKIGELCRKFGAIFHVDAAQAGYEKIDIIESNIDLLSISGHKIYAPIGVGVLIVDSMLSLKPTPLIHGGLQQENLRSGTISPQLCDAMGLAIAKMDYLRESEKIKLENLRTLLISALHQEGISFAINGSMQHRHPGNLNISLLGYANDLVVQKLQPDFAISTGSACNAGIIQSSYVLEALGLSEERIRSAIRIGIGRFNSEEDILAFAQRLGEVLKSMPQHN